MIVNSHMHQQKNRRLCLILPPSPNNSTFRAVLNQTFVSLTNFIGKNIKIYYTKRVHYEKNIFHDVSNDTNFVSKILVLFPINSTKLAKV